VAKALSTTNSPQIYRIMGNEGSKGAGADGSGSGSGKKRGNKKPFGNSAESKVGADGADTASAEAAARDASATALSGAVGLAAEAEDDTLDIRSSLSRQKLADASEKPVTVDDFDLLKVIGKGSFGKVFLVCKKGGVDDGATYAMKALRKDVLLKRNQIEHTKTERTILESVDHPFIVCLRYAFQSREKLYLVTGTHSIRG
jgi:hypothetical protein